jgi:hypothetical protein
MKRLAGAVLAASIVLLAACGRLDMAHYEKLKVGQSFDEVVGILGKPDRCDEMLGLRQCQWGNDNRYVRVAFAGNTVLTLVAHNLK